MTQAWYWRDGSLRCRLLDRWQHYFLTRDQVPPRDALYAKQVHGNRCIYGATDQEADGLWLRGDDHRSVWVCSADCVPILIADRGTGAVAAVHSGWRGTAAAIGKVMVTTLLNQGCRPANLIIALGPAISGEMYQVGIDVADRVLQTLETPVGVLADDVPGHCRLDLRLVQQQQFLEMGIPAENIQIAPYCTFRSADLFYSYRRSRQENDRDSLGKVQWSGIRA